MCLVKNIFNNTWWYWVVISLLIFIMLDRVPFPNIHQLLFLLVESMSFTCAHDTLTGVSSHFLIYLIDRYAMWPTSGQRNMKEVWKFHSSLLKMKVLDNHFLSPLPISYITPVMLAYKVSLYRWGTSLRIM